MYAPKKGDRIRVVLEGTVTMVREHEKCKEKCKPGTAIYLETDVHEHGAVMYYAEEATSVELIRPEVKAGQVWRVTSHVNGFTEHYIAQLRAIGAGLTLAPSDVTQHCVLAEAEFFNCYPDAKLVFDPEA